MRWVNALSDSPDTHEAVIEASEKIAEQGLSRPPDLVVCFAGTEHHNAYEQLPGWIEMIMNPRHLIGCGAGGVIGAGRELENQPGLTMTAGWLPDVILKTFHLDAEEMADLEAEELEIRLGISAADRPSFLLLPDPFSFPADDLIKMMDWVYPGCPKAGGLASGGTSRGETALFLGDQTHNGGVVGLSLSGEIEMNTVVAQGCRPIGAPMFITRCRDNMLYELNNQPVRNVLTELFNGLSARDQALFQSSLFLGLEMQPRERAYQQGDFLIRNIMGIIPGEGSLVIGANLQETGVAQFHLRDAQTSREDLEMRLSRFAEDEERGEAAGALLFSCLGRGRGLYGTPDHDSRLFQAKLGKVPLGGFFCNGEIGPVQGQTFIHGYTSSFAVFSVPREEPPLVGG